MTSADEQLRRVATPSRLGQYLAPIMWGPGATYDVDPWLALTEERVLDGVLDEINQRFIRIHCPPQVGKSSYSGLFLPLWILGMFPDRRIIFISYSDDYSRLRGGEVRDAIKAFGQELFGISVDPDRESAGDWRLKGHRGGMLSVGIGSQIAGRSGDIVIMDDIIKNMQEATSVAVKALHIREYDGTIRPRLQPGGTMLMTNTRFADDDLGGTLEDRAKQPGYRGDNWEALSFPAIAEPPDDEVEKAGEDWRDVLGRPDGQPLQCRFTDPKMAWEQTVFYAIRRSTDPFTFSCLYQQNPVSRVGGMFPVDRWARYRRSELPPMTATCRIWEPAATQGGGDWSIGMKMGRDNDGRIYILDVWRGQLSSDLVLAQARTLAAADGFETEIGVEQEKAGAGKSVLTFWEIELGKLGYRVFPCKPEGSKEVRASPASTLQQGAQLLIPHEDDGVEWVPILIDQARRMMGDGRRGRHDDMIDAYAYGVMKLLNAYGASEWWDASGLNLDAEAQMRDLMLRHELGIR